jgi:hypothetical protein
MRREALLGHSIPNKNGAVLHALPTERSRDMRTAEQVRELIPWVSLKSIACNLPDFLASSNRLKTSLRDFLTSRQLAIVSPRYW